jgi:hypothetical protein
LREELHEPASAPDESAFIDPARLCDLRKRCAGGPAEEGLHEVDREALDVPVFVDFQAALL